MAFADDLKASREAMELSLLEASKKVGIAYNTFKRYEAGETVPAPERQEELILKLEASEEDSDISSLLNNLAQQQIEKMKKEADENRLLLPLLRKMGVDVTNLGGGYYTIKSGTRYSDVLTYEELLRILEKLKSSMWEYLDTDILEFQYESTNEIEFDESDLPF